MQKVNLTHWKTTSELTSVLFRSTEEVFQALEDNQVKLSTMKASRFVKAFEQEVDHWERTLSHILEAVELLLTVQRQWMYLEVSRGTRQACCAKFILGNIKMYLHFLSFIKTKIMQKKLKFFHMDDKDTFILYNQYH